MLTFNFNNISPEKDSFMLDAGCGPGRHVFGFMDQFPDITCVGVDLDSNSLQEGKTNLTLFSSISNKESTFLQGSVYNLPFSDNAFETIICSEVLEHVADVDATLKELTRLLKPGGNLLISVPSYLPERLCWKYSKKYKQTPGGHIRIFSNKLLLENFQKLNLRIFKKNRMHSFHSLYWILRARNDMDETPFLKKFHSLLVKQMFGQAKISALIEKLLDPIFGKSKCFYLRK